MSADVPLALFDLVAFEAAPVALWIDVLRECGYAGADLAAVTSHDAVATLLAGRRVPDAFLRVLQLAHDLGTDAGREAIDHAARERNVDLSRWQSDPNPVTFVLRLWLAHDDLIDTVLARSQLVVVRAKEPRTYHEFAGARRATIRDLAAARKKLEIEFKAWCAANDRGDYAEVRCFPDGAVVRFQVLHAHRDQTPVVVENQARKVIRFTPAQCEIVEYDADTRRLRIAARSQPVVRALMTIFGAVLFDDPAFFANDATCSLEPLRAHGARALEAHRLAHVIASVRLVECLIDRRDGRKLWLSSRDCFKDLREMGISNHEVDWIDAKLEFTFATGTSRRTVVTVHTPNRVSYRHDLREADIERYLEQVGIRVPDDAAQPVDLWSLHPWIWPRAQWARYVGPALDDMVTAGILRPVELSHVAHPDYPAEGAVLEVQWVEEQGRRVPFGVSTDPGVPQRSLTPSDIAGFELDVEKLARRIARDLTLTGAVGPAGPSGTFALGERTLGGQRVRVAFVTRDPAAAPAQVWQPFVATAAVSTVALAPAGRTLPVLVKAVELRSIVPPFDDLLLPIARELGLEDQLSPAERRQPGVRLFIDRTAGSVSLDGVALSGLSPGTEVYNLLVCLAAAAPDRVPAETIRKALGLRSADPARIRDIKRELREKIERALTEAGRSTDGVEGMFPKGSANGHAIGVRCQVV